MAKRRMAMMALFLGFCLWLTPVAVIAASTADAVEPIDVSRDGTLTLTYGCDGTAFEGVSVKLYAIATVSADFQYTLTPTFATTALVLNGVQTTGEWNVIRSTLEAYVLADGIAAHATATTDAAGQVCFESLDLGLYLAMVGTVTEGETVCVFDSALVAVPGLGTDGLWQYEVAVASKSEIIPPDKDDVEYKVLKLWKGDEGSDTRPASIEVELFRDGVSQQKVELSQENNWSYSWTAEADGAKWTAMERHTPIGYTMTVDQRDTTFVLTNTFTAENPPDAPPTGDTSHVMWYVILMIGSGSLLLILGIVGKRKAYENVE